MATSDPKIVLEPETWDQISKSLTYLDGMMRAAIPGGSNGPRGPVFPNIVKNRDPIIASDDTAGLPPVQYQGQVYQGVVDGRPGADYVPSVEAFG